MTKSSLSDANNRLKQAEKDLIKTLESAYPKGRRILVSLGGNKIEVKVVSHNKLYAGRMTGQNVKTEKYRRFHFSSVIEKLD